MKKLICLLLALGMMTAAFSCGDDDEDDSRKKSSKSSVSDDEDEESEEETTKRSRRDRDSSSVDETEPETEEETTEPETEPAPVIDNWRDVYYNKLMAVIASPDYVIDWDGGTGFSLEDLDCDGTPELFVSYNYEQPVEIYTCEGDELISLGNAGNYGYLYLIPEKHLLVSSEYDTMVRITTDSYMGLNNNELVTVITTGTEYNEMGELFNWYVNDECVDEKKYNEMIDLYDGGKEVLGHEFRANITEIELALYDSGSWENAYSELLTEIAEKRSEGTYSTFSLYDVTGDGVPELFVSEGYYHAACVGVYTYDGRLYCIGRLGTYGGLSYDVEPKTLSVANMHMGYEYGVNCEVRDHRLVRVFQYYNNCGAVEDESEYEYSVNGKTVTQAEYDAAMAAHSTKHYVWLGGDNELNSATAGNVAEGIYTESKIQEITAQ